MAWGSVFRRSGRWVYRVDAGFQPDTGKRRQMLKQGFATKKEAEVALAEAIRDVSCGSAVSKSSVRVEDFLNDWLVTVKSRLRPTTWYSYEMVVARINAHLGRYSLQSLTPLQIEKFHADLLATGSYKGEELAPKTVRNTHVVLRKRCPTLNASVSSFGTPRVRRARRSPCGPINRRGPRMTSSRSSTLFRATSCMPGYVLLATTGMRRGEVLGLRWADVDFDDRQIAITQTLSTAGEELVIGPPKTPRSRRHVYLECRAFTTRCWPARLIGPQQARPAESNAERYPK